MKDWREARNRHWKGKGRRVVLAGAILVVAMLWLGACMMRPGSKLWHMVSAQEAYQTCELKAGQYCSEAIEPRKIYYEYPIGCLTPEPVCGGYYTSVLFEQRLSFILYGEVEGIKNYVIQGDAMRDGKKVKPVPYYCHVTTVRVKRGIYGGIEENQRVNLLCRWKYEERDYSSDMDWEYVEKGKRAIFLVEGNAARIEDQERGERIDILGKIPNERGSRVVECKEYKINNLGRIRSKKEVEDYYLDHRIVWEPEK